MNYYEEDVLTSGAQDAVDRARKTIIKARGTAEILETKYELWKVVVAITDGRRLHRLKLEYDDCKAAVNAARAVEEGAYTTYAQTISKNFTTAFLSALPRELRDHVYSYLWDDEDMIRQTKRSVREYAWSYRMPEFCAPSYVQPDHVGQVVAEELALSIYRRAFGRRLHVIVSAGHICKFLAANPLRSSLKPADCINALDIEWYPNEYSDKAVMESCKALANYAFPRPIPIKFILGKFSTANSDKPKPMATLEDQLGVFKPAYVVLVSKGFPVTVKSLSGNETEVGSCS
ncbi:hypothetical protein C7974DRAFT_402869 [Boeremia exigua]|uniref:uncharacterized protein n=1 Tax=Boeremia exigua TaxID=749465 RepID=UPI001E8D0F53|nr:uncharacterized protein C7974DRAFT_402869 [Boeremia exigua]KAH6614896.1 hypothetical protein C7974DRAFT_402869 [Boeremia exigua]